MRRWDRPNRRVVLQVTLRDGGAPRIDDFEVTRASGCYFLRYA